MSEAMRASINPKKLKVLLTWDFVFICGAIIAITLEPIFKSASALLFILFVLIVLFRHIGKTVLALGKFWYLLILPFYCLISIFWSLHPGDTFKYSLELIITLAFAIVIATRISANDFLKILFYAFGIGVVCSILFGRSRLDGAWLGIFQSKNAFADFMANFSLLALAVALNPDNKKFLRILATIGALISVPMISLGQSFGVLVTIFPSIVVILFVINLRRIPNTFKFFIVFAALFFALLAGLIYYGYANEINSALLKLGGKDTTLTGRTYLWEYGRSLIAQRPLLGTGYRAFWVVGNPDAEAIWDHFGILGKSGFNFHNVYITNAVELGYIGLIIQIFIFYGAILQALYLAFKECKIEYAYMLGLLLYILSRSFIEAVFFYHFGLPSILIYSIFVYCNLKIFSRTAKVERVRPVLGRTQKKGEIARADS
ncbi:O-antigen ligase family protein [Asticcacaulis sp. 201]|uniref:O-antigen ligase family protein n=1 Tax=Asticcacaulis sp. 201 TaxID=3028787 RepID=UPI00291665C9|nr:O-antigen ligase family protein [Asticcacaulis sp. 201]MDV6331084.1 O-antigen ligase family protein [Asticcacaulis sp. 201]